MVAATERISRDVICEVTAVDDDKPDDDNADDEMTVDWSNDYTMYFRLFRMYFYILIFMTASERPLYDGVNTVVSVTWLKSQLACEKPGPRFRILLKKTTFSVFS